MAVTLPTGDVSGQKSNVTPVSAHVMLETRETCVIISSDYPWSAAFDVGPRSEFVTIDTEDIPALVVTLIQQMAKGGSSNAVAANLRMILAAGQR